MRLLTLALIAAFALTSVPAFSEEEKKTGFTDGQTSESGTNVVTGQETEPVGAKSGTNPTRVKHGKNHRKGKKYLKRETNPVDQAPGATESSDR